MSGLWCAMKDQIEQTRELCLWMACCLLALGFALVIFQRCGKMNDDGIETPKIIVHDVESALSKLADDLHACMLVGAETVSASKMLERVAPIAAAVSEGNRKR